MATTDADWQKEVEFFAAGVNAWYGTALEHDKSLLTLSAGGVGLLTTLLSTVGVSSVFVLILHAVAMLAFLTSLAAVLVIFKRNKHHIEQVFRGNDAPDPALATLDGVAIWAFGIGALFAAIVGVSSAVASYSDKHPQEQIMSNEKRNELPKVPRMTYDSVNGVAVFKESFNGVAQMKPQPAPQNGTGNSTTTTTQNSSSSGTKK